MVARPCQIGGNFLSNILGPAQSPPFLKGDLATVLPVKSFLDFRAFYALSVSDGFQWVSLRTMEFRMVSNLRMQAVIATFFSFPAAMRR